MEKLTLILVGLFLLIYGLDHATNLEIVWMQVIGALCALAAGVVCIIRALK
jgi:hypothetical protein